MHYANLTEAMEKGVGRERAFLCHVHNDTSPSASVNAATGYFICYTCGAKGRYQDGDFEIAPDSMIAEIERVEALTSVVEPKPDTWLTKYCINGPGDYWLSRFSPETCEHFQLGQIGTDAVYPYRDTQGNLIGVVSRDVTGQRKAKYLYPKNSRMGENLFNYHRCSGDVLILTEGATDAMAAWQVGLRDTMAIYGSALRPVQAWKLHQYNPKLILTAFDQDDAGDSAHRSVCRQMWDVSVKRLTWDTYKDIAEMDVADRQDFSDWICSEYLTS